MHVVRCDGVSMIAIHFYSPTRLALILLLRYIAADGPWMVTVYFTLFLTVRRVFILLLTAATSFPATYMFTFVSNFLPAYYFSRDVFFRSDDPPEEIALTRERAFDEMQKHWERKWPKSLAVSGGCRVDLSLLSPCSATSVSQVTYRSNPGYQWRDAM